MTFGKQTSFHSKDERSPDVYHFRMVYVCLISVSVLLLSGCAFFRGNYGDRFDPKEIDAIHKGVSTRQDVTNRLGAPDRIIEVNDQEIFQYYNYELKSGAVLFFSRTNIKGNDLYIFFNDDGTVAEIVFGKQKAPPKMQFWPFGK